MKTKPQTKPLFRCVECRDYYTEGMFYAEPPPWTDGTYHSGICETCAERYSPEIRRWNPGPLLLASVLSVVLTGALLGILILLNK